MREQHRHRPMLETLDLRIVPSAVAVTPVPHAAAAEHASIAGSVHATSVHHRTKAHHHAVVHHPARPVYPAPVYYPYVAPSTNRGATTGSASPTGSSSSSSVTPVATTTTISTTTATAASPTASAQARASGSGSGSGSTATTSIVATHENTTPTSPTTTTGIGDAENGPLAKAGVDLITIYQEFQAQGGSSTFTSSKAGVIKIQGGTVGVDIHTTGSNFGQFVSTMSSLGMHVQTQDATHGIVEGFLPIGQLPTVAQNAQTVAISPIYVVKKF